MSNTPIIGKHSMAIVHRVVKRRQNRRIIIVRKFWAGGMFSNRTNALIQKQQIYHPTKGLRTETA